MTAAAPSEIASEDNGDIDIPITLRAGAEWDNGRIRYRVVSHIYRQKPRLKLVGPSLERICPECRAA